MSVWELGNAAVARVPAEPDAFAGGDDSPGGPEGVVLVPGTAGGGVLAREARDAGGDGVGG